MTRPKQLFRLVYASFVVSGIVAGCGPQVSTFTTTSSNLTTIEPVPTSTSTTAGDSSSSASTGGASTAGGSSHASGGVSATGPSSSSDATGDVSTSAAVTTTEPAQDVGSVHDFGDGTPKGCKGKIDFLFVMATASSLLDIQPAIRAALPKFIDTIATKFEDFDVHIMVVDADPEWGIPNCTAVCPDLLTCKNKDPCCPESWGGDPEKLCCPILDPENYPCEELDLVGECEWTLGAGNVFSAGELGANKPCKIDGGHRYITQDQTEMSETFSCMAQLGMTGGTWVGQSLVQAVSPELNDPGGCNEGFLRDDALLVITMLSAGWDPDSEGTPKDWYEAVVAAKNGDPGAIVMLLMANPECPDWDEPCKMAKRFPYHIVTDDDAQDLSLGFDAATDLVEVACEKLIPQ